MSRSFSITCIARSNPFLTLESVTGSKKKIVRSGPTAPSRSAFRSRPGKRSGRLPDASSANSMCDPNLGIKKHLQCLVVNRAWQWSGLARLPDRRSVHDGPPPAPHPLDDQHRAIRVARLCSSFPPSYAWRLRLRSLTLGAWTRSPTQARLVRRRTPVGAPDRVRRGGRRRALRSRHGCRGMWAMPSVTTPAPRAAAMPGSVFADQLEGTGEGVPFRCPASWWVRSRCAPRAASAAARVPAAPPLGEHLIRRAGGCRGRGNGARPPRDQGWTPLQRGRAAGGRGGAVVDEHAVAVGQQARARRHADAAPSGRPAPGCPLLRLDRVAVS